VFARDGRGAPAQREKDPQAAIALPRRANGAANLETTMRRALLAAALLPIPAFAHPAFAQTPPTVTLPEVVVTATGTPTLLDRIPAGVTVIDRATIEARGAGTLVEALGAVPGVTVAQSGPSGGNASAFIRGTNSNHVLVLRDGMPINDPSDPGGLFNFGVDTLADVERIEMVRGPMSSLYGSGAIGGVINLITRRGQGRPAATVEIAGGLPAQARGAASLSGSTGRFDYSLSAEARDEAGFDSIPRRQSVHTGARNPFRSATGTVNLGFTPMDGTRIGLFLRGRSSTFLLDSQGFPAYDANAYRGFDTTVQGRLSVSHMLLDGAWQTIFSLGRLHSDRHYKQPLEPGDPNFTTSDARYHGRRTELRWDNTLKLPQAGPATDSALVFGAVHTEDSSTSTLVANFAGFPYANSIRSSATSDAGHVGGQTTLWNRLTVTGDIRAEEGRYGGGTVTWRVGAVLAVPEIASRFRASYGTAFRAPSLYDLFGQDTSGYIGNPNLKPERSEGYELGWAIDLPGGGRPDAGTLDVAYFNSRIRDLIQIVYGPGFTSSTSQNVAHARAQGIEASLTLRPAPWLDATIAYTWTETRDLTTGTALLRRPHDQVSINARITPLPGLTLTPELIYTGAFRDFLIDDNGFPIGNGRAKPGTVLNLGITYALTEQLTLFGAGRNLGGSRFEPANGFQMPGTTLIAGVRARF
jgi:vitamin B12 transporter